MAKVAHCLHRQGRVGKGEVGQEEGVSWLGTAAHQSGKAGIDNACQA